MPQQEASREGTGDARALLAPPPSAGTGPAFVTGVGPFAHGRGIFLKGGYGRMRGRIMHPCVRVCVENRNKTGKNRNRWPENGTKEGIL